MSGGSRSSELVRSPSRSPGNLRSQTRRGLLSVLQPSEGEKTAQRGRVEVKTGLRGAEEDGWRPQNPYRQPGAQDRKSTRLNSSHVKISYAVFCLKKKN